MDLEIRAFCAYFGIQNVFKKFEISVSVSVIFIQSRRNLLSYGQFLSFTALSFGAQSIKKPDRNGTLIKS